MFRISTLLILSVGSAYAEVPAPGTYVIPIDTNSDYAPGSTMTLFVAPQPTTPPNTPPVTPPPITTPPVTTPPVTTPPVTTPPVTTPPVTTPPVTTPPVTTPPVTTPPVTTPPSTTSTATPPAQAQAAGFSNLAFFDDFTDATTIAPSTSPASGYKWYWSQGGVSSSDYYTVTPGSYLGATGVLTINKSDNGYNADLQTIPTRASGSQRDGTWQHGYFEARIQFATTPPSGAGRGWPSFWTFAVQAQSPVAGQLTAEWDILEAFLSGSVAQVFNTGHNWMNTSTSSTGTDTYNTNGTNLQVSLQGSTEPAQPTDGGWHTYGCLWWGDGVTGYIQCYYDDQLVVHENGKTTFPTGQGAGLSAQESDNMYMLLGTGTGWPINVDWVKVWQ